MVLFMIVYFFACIATMIVAVPIHELGHLIFGKLTGYEFLTFRLGNFLWSKEKDGKIKFSKSPRVGAILGQCLMNPTADVKKFRYKLYNAGGGLLNILTGLITLPVCIFAEKDSVLAAIPLGFTAISLFFGLFNLIPIRSQLPNDGANMREAAKSDIAVKGLYMMLKITHEMQNGKFTEDYPEETFLLPENPDYSNFFVCFLVFLRSEQLQNQGRYEEAKEVMSPIADNVDILKKLPMFHSVQAVFDYVFICAVGLNDLETAQNAVNRFTGISEKHKKYLDALLTSKSPVMSFRQAVFVGILGKDTEKAQKLIAETYKILPTLGNIGQQHSIEIALAALENYLSAHTQAAVS